MATDEVALLELYSEEWFKFSREFVYEHYAGRMRRALFLYASLFYRTAEIKAHVDNWDTSVSVNDLTHAMRNAMKSSCEKHNIKWKEYRVYYSASRNHHIAYKEGKRGAELVDAVKPHHTLGNRETGEHLVFLYSYLRLVMLTRSSWSFQPSLMGANQQGPG